MAYCYEKVVAEEMLNDIWPKYNKLPKKVPSTQDTDVMGLE